VSPDGLLINFFTRVDLTAAPPRMHLTVINSADGGDTWSAPVTVAEMRTAGVHDPERPHPPMTGTGMRRRRAEEAERQQLAAERARIAGELHDSVTHHVTAMVAQADAAQFLIDTAAERAKDGDLQPTPATRSYSRVRHVTDSCHTRDRVIMARRKAPGEGWCSQRDSNPRYRLESFQ
jgi:hypothetical protein